MTVAETGELNTEGIAQLLEQAWLDGKQIQPLTEAAGLSSIEDAYAIQFAWGKLRKAAGDTATGRKIGITSRAAQEKMGVSEPDFGYLWASRQVEVAARRASVAADRFVQPRVEAEFAFLIGRSLPPGNVTAADVLAATEAVAPSFEIVDSRIEDWRVTIQDTIADNASFGAYAIADWDPGLDPSALDGVSMEIVRNGAIIGAGAGSVALGHPANAVAWLVNRMRDFKAELVPGDMILSGAVAVMIPAAAGDTFALRIAGDSVLSLTFT